jgi:large subunit ribosomal protein L28
MARTCPVTNRGPLVGGRYSNRTRATKFNPVGKIKRQVNLKNKKIFIPELNKSVRVTVSTKALRTITKNGALKTLKAAGLV